MALIAFAAMITPGPNNLLVTESAATRSLLATGAVMAVIVGGSMMMLAVTQMGASSLLAASPDLHLGLKVISAAVLIGLGVAMMLGSSATGDLDRKNPVGPLAVLGLQFVNPKGW
jgi:threonine/homoserine/homoserine lactone efflux protein